jgi:hypothetical protein
MYANGTGCPHEIPRLDSNITLTGNFGPGIHSVAVDYVNGFDGDSANANRTLYVNAITLDGATTTLSDVFQYRGAHTYSIQSGWMV